LDGLQWDRRQRAEEGETVDMGDGRAMMDEGGDVGFQRLDAGFLL
jgi:hypothetical protein